MSLINDNVNAESIGNSLFLSKELNFDFLYINETYLNSFVMPNVLNTKYFYLCHIQLLCTLKMLI